MIQRVNMLTNCLTRRSVSVQCCDSKDQPMLNRIILIALATALPLTAAPAQARKKGEDQDRAREQMNSGKVLSLREIEGRVVPRMRGMEYLGPEYDGYAQVYRLKFIDAGRVIFVDVDARSGSILRQR
jgi:uncharacterized membrane protein YkoI